MSVSPELTARKERHTFVLPCTKAQRAAPKKLQRSRTDGDFTHPQSPTAASTSAHTHSCRDTHTYTGSGEVLEHAKHIHQRKAEGKFIITIKKFHTSSKNNNKVLENI